MKKNIITILGSLLVLMGGVSIFLPLLLAPASVGPVDVAWYLLSFIIGLSMVVLPTTLPAALLVVPLAARKGILHATGAIALFGAGILLTLSFYGVLISLMGKEGMSILGLHIEDVLYWSYFFSGIFVYILALGEIGLLRLPYASPSLKEVKTIDVDHPRLELFFLGIFLGNIGISGVHSGIPLLLLDASTSGNIFYGWSLFFMNALGRMFPLLVLVILSVRGVPALEWVIARKKEIRHISGWAMLSVAVFLIVLGFFGSDWLSGNLRYGDNTQFVPISYVLLGNACLALLLLFPLWYSYFTERRRALFGDARGSVAHLEHFAEDHFSARSIAALAPETAEKHLAHVTRDVEGVKKQQHILENIVRHDVSNTVRSSLKTGDRARSLRLERDIRIIFSSLLLLLLLLIPYEFETFRSGSASLDGQPSAPFDIFQ